MVNEVTLLDFWPSPFGMRVRIALALKGIDYKYKEENLPAGKSPLLLKTNPVHKKIPVLIHNGKPICESLVIVEYIDEIWKDKSPLLPSDPFKLAQARFWADYAGKKVYELQKQIWRRKGEDQEITKKEYMKCLKVLEGELGDKPYFGGETLGYLDVVLVPLYSRFYTIDTLGNLSIEAECPKLVTWAKKCMHNEAVAKCIPDQHKVYQFILEIKKKFGI